MFTRIYWSTPGVSFDGFAVDVTLPVMVAKVFVPNLLADMTFCRSASLEMVLNLLNLVYCPAGSHFTMPLCYSSLSNAHIPAYP
jgi:hypothetical protein